MQECDHTQNNHTCTVITLVLDNIITRQTCIDELHMINKMKGCVVLPTIRSCVISAKEIV